MIVFPNCKINLGLQVRRKRSDGFHDLETIFYPLPLQDVLELVRVNDGPPIAFTSSGNTVTDSAEANSCVKAYTLLKNRFPGIAPVKMHLHKVIPSGAGLGGGSADAAFSLQLINDVLELGLAKDVLAQLALELGSDCPFFIYNKAAFAQGRGERLQELKIDLAGYKLRLVHPALHVSTAEAFRNIRVDEERASLLQIAARPINEWADCLHNDFEESVFLQYPLLAGIKKELYAQGALYASMSGSGSSVYGLFAPGVECPPHSFPPAWFLRDLELS